MAKSVNHIQPLDNFVKGALDFLPDEFLRELPNITDMLTIFIERLSVIDKSFVDLAQYRTLALASGVNLDSIGNRLGIYRNDLSDDDYRTILLIKTISLRNGGTRSDIITSLGALVGDENFQTYKGTDYRFDIALISPCFELRSVIDEILDLLPIITNVRIVETSGIPFGFEGDSGAGGFGSVNKNTETGAFSSLRYTSKTT